MARRSEHSQEEIRTMVLTAAENIVKEEGLAALKVRKIAMEIGYTVGSIYMVFENMADLILHLKGQALDDLSAQLDDVDTSLASRELIETLAIRYLDFARQNYHRWHMVFETSSENGDSIPEWYQQKANHMFDRVDAEFKRMAPQISAEQCQLSARALWAGVHGICQLALSGKLGMLGVDDTANLVTMQVDCFLAGWQQQQTQ